MILGSIQMLSRANGYSLSLESDRVCGNILSDLDRISFLPVLRMTPGTAALNHVYWLLAYYQLPINTCHIDNKTDYSVDLSINLAYVDTALIVDKGD
jgi:hypothetical protein